MFNWQQAVSLMSVSSTRGITVIKEATRMGLCHKEGTFDCAVFSTVLHSRNGQKLPMEQWLINAQSKQKQNPIQNTVSKWAIRE